MEKRESGHANSSSVGVHLPHLCEQSEEDDERSCDSHMTLGEEPKETVQLCQQYICMIPQLLINCPRLQGVCSCCPV